MKTQNEIQEWLVAQIAAQLSVPPETVDVTEPFNAYGLSSRDTVSVSPRSISTATTMSYQLRTAACSCRELVTVNSTAEDRLT